MSTAQPSANVTYYNPAELPSSPAYSHAAVVAGGRLVIVSGQQALDAQGQLVGAGDFRRQAEQVFANVKRALRTAGADVTHVVAIDTHFVGHEHLSAYRDARRAFFADRHVPPPASTTVEVSGLVAEGALLEVGVTAVVPEAHPAPVSARAVTVVAVLRARDGKDDELQEALAANAEKTREEAGCLSYVVHRGLDDRNRFAIYETWTTREALADHFEMPYMRALAGRREELMEQRDVWTFEVLP